MHACTSRTATCGKRRNLVVAVGLGVAFLLFMAFLNVVKSGNLLNDSNLLYAALIFYSGAGTLYLRLRQSPALPSYVRFASLRHLGRPYR